MVNLQIDKQYTCVSTVDLAGLSYYVAIAKFMWFNTLAADLKLSSYKF